MGSRAYDQVLDRLERVTGSGDERVASCPVPSHGKGRGDRNPSLSVAWRDGKVLLNCMNHCDVHDILLAIGLDFPDLFDAPLDMPRTLVATYTYTDPAGKPYHVAQRYQQGDGKSYIQRLPGAEKAGLPRGFKPALYRLPKVLEAAANGGVVYVVEGEKCVHAAEALGLTATTGPNGGKAWWPYFGAWLKGCSKVVICIDRDKDGRHHARLVRDNLVANEIPFEIKAPRITAEGADLYDHVQAGFKEADLMDVDIDRTRPGAMAFADLLATDFPSPRWAVKDLVSAGGVTLLGGAPKMGKSQVTLDIALGVACGGRALDGLECNQGAVLYLSLDNDSQRRIKARALYLLGHHLPDLPIPIEVHTDWPIGTEAVDACQEWAAAATNPLLVVVDTYVRVEPEFDGDGRGNSYAASVRVLSRWARFAADNDVAVVAVHHDRKGNGENEDWMDRFMGSRGVTATAHTLMMLEAKRGESEGVLHVAGRDIGTKDLPVMRQGWRWTVEAPPLPFPGGLRVVQ